MSSVQPQFAPRSRACRGARERSQRAARQAADSRRILMSGRPLELRSGWPASGHSFDYRPALVTGIVTKTPRDEPDVVRRVATARCRRLRPAWVCATGGTGWDGDRLAHNPEVGGSNPPPATSFRRSGPFPITERAFCASRTVVKGVVGAGLRAARRRDGGDGVTRDETAWTWWTPPPAIAGCLAQR